MVFSEALSINGYHNEISPRCLYTLFPFLRFTFIEISIVLDLQKIAIFFKLHFITIILNVITSCIYIDNGMKVKTDSGCSLIENDIYLKESEF